MTRPAGFVLLLLAIASTSALVSLTASDAQKATYHHGLEGVVYNDLLGGLPDTVNSLFQGSGKCAGCHAEDPNELASIAGQTFPMEPMPDGWDVNVVDDWRSSLMANSTKDPFWRAKVRHEVITNPSHAAGLEDKCTSCHAPVGHFAAHHDGAEYYSLLESLTDSLALDGVSCAVCHQQDADGIGTRFSGEMTFVEDTIYGQYGGGKDDYPIQWQPMFNFVGLMPVYGEHMTRSESCAACHSLVTSSVDLDGEYTGATVIEQATYHEWVNSVYDRARTTGVPRMPHAANRRAGGHRKRIRLAPAPVALQPALLRGGQHPHAPHAAEQRRFPGADGLRSPIRQHHQPHPDHARRADPRPRSRAHPRRWLAPGGSASDQQGGTQVPLGLSCPTRLGEIKSGENGQTLFHSGAWSPETGHILGQEDVAWEPHHDIIDDPADVLIYEPVLGDVNGDPTTLLERAHEHLKDNRMTPRGFSTAHAVYDTTAIIGGAWRIPISTSTRKAERGVDRTASNISCQKGGTSTPC